MEQAKYEKGNIIDAINIILTAYAFVINFFPIISSMEKRSTESGLSAVTIAMSFCFFVYLTFSVFAYIVYGDNINPNIFVNLQLEHNFASIFVRTLFLLIFICNIPFIFLPGKEALLIMLDEAMRRTMSLQIMKRIDQQQKGVLLQPLQDLTHNSLIKLMSVKECTCAEDSDLYNDQEHDHEEEFKASKISESVSNTVYYINTIGLYTLELIAAIYINDVTIIFGFFAGISESLINFFIPAAFYLISCKVGGKKTNPILAVLCYLYFVIGSCLTVFSLYHNFAKMNWS